MRCVNTIIRSALRQQGDDEYNLLVLPYNGDFEYMLASVPGFNIFVAPVAPKFAWSPTCVGGSNLYNWHYIENLNMLPIDVDFDAIICNDRKSQYDIARQLSEYLCLPIIMVEHDYTPPQQASMFKHTQRQDAQVFCSPSIELSWGGNGAIIPYTMQDYFLSITPSSERENKALLVGDYQPNEYNIINQIAAESGKVTVLTRHPQGPTTPADRGVLENEYWNSKVFVNLMPDNHIPIQLLQAMQHGCAIVANEMPILHDILDNTNAMFCSSIPDFAKAIKRIYEDDTLQESMGQSAKSALRRMGGDTFKDEWSILVANTCDKTYIRSV